MAYHAPVAGERPTAAQWLDWVFRRCIADFTSSTRPASPLEGQPGFETDTDKLIMHDGTSWIELGKLGAWSTYTPTWTGATTNPVIGNGTLSGRYQRLFGRIGLVDVRIDTGTTTTFGSGGWSLSLPSGWTASRAVNGLGLAFGGAGIYPIYGYAAATTTLTLYYTSPVAGVTATTPFAWGSGHTLVAACLIELTS